MILPNFENVKINGGSFTYYMLRACCKYLAYVTIYNMYLFCILIHYAFFRSFVSNSLENIVIGEWKGSKGTIVKSS